MTDIVERLRHGIADRGAEHLMDEAADEIERLMAEHDDYVIRANANVCELNREIERLRESIDTLIRERDAERRAYNGAITGHLAENDQLRVALEIIAGRRQCLDNLMGNVDVACAALDGKRP